MLWLKSLCACVGAAAMQAGAPVVGWAELDEVEGRWLEIAIPLEQGGAVISAPVRLEVELVLRGRSERPTLLLVEGEAELHGLFNGERRVLFYVHPEVVEHYRLERRAMRWRIVLGGEETVGRELAQQSPSVAIDSNLTRRLPLLKIYETAFWSENFPDKLAESPAYVR